MMNSSTLIDSSQSLSEHHQKKSIDENFQSEESNRTFLGKNFNSINLEKHQRNISKNDWQNIPFVTLCKIFSYLSSDDRLNASTTCNLWRSAIYNSSLWPQKYLKVNLCPHKFSLGHQKKLKFNCGFEIFKLENSFPFRCSNKATTAQQSNFSSSWINDQRKLYNNGGGWNGGGGKSSKQKPNRKNFNEQLKSFIQKCSRFLNGITFYFDPNSSHNVLDLIKIIKYLSENEIAIYDVLTTNNHHQTLRQNNCHSNCRNLRYFSIVPVTPLVRCASDQRFMSLYSGLTEALRFFFSKCSNLEHVSLGNLHELIHATETFFAQFVKSELVKKFRCLHLSSIKGDVYRYVPQQTPLFESIEMFKNLKCLSLDFDVLNTKVVNGLVQLESLEKLSINVHRINRYHPGISTDAWSLLAINRPTLGVSLNLLHTESTSFQVIIDSLLNTEIPLRHFRAYYLEFKEPSSQQDNNSALALFCQMFDILGQIHLNTLKSVCLVDNVVSPNKYLKSVSPNVLVMLTWRCKSLSHLTIIGYEITDMDIIAMARLRGDSLKTFCFLASCVQLTPDYGPSKLSSSSSVSSVSSSFHYHHNQPFPEFTTFYELASHSRQRRFNKAVSSPLKRKWEPIYCWELPEIMATNFVPQITYHRTITDIADCSSIHYRHQYHR